MTLDGPSVYAFGLVVVRAACVAVLISTAVWATEQPATKEEEVDLDALTAEEGAPPAGSTAATRVPEHDYDRRLLAFPVLLILILAWNVKWKKTPHPPKAPQ